MKKKSLLFAISLTAIGTMLGGLTSCNNTTPDTPDTPIEPDEPVDTTVDVTSVSLNLETKEIYAGEEFQLTATVAPGDASNQNVTWASSNTSVATVTEGGKVVGVSEGETTITVKTVDGEFTATCKVTVKAVLVPAVHLSTENDVEIVDTNATLQCTANVVNMENTAVTWSSSDTSVATVDENGLVTTVDAFNRSSKVTITATSVEDPTISDSVELTVKKLAIDNVYVRQVTKNANFVKFDANKVAQANEENTFAVTNLEHQVGDDNGVDFKPGITYINSDEEDVAYSGAWSYNITLKKYDSEAGQYVDVTTSEYADSVDKVNAKVDFKESAIGGKFKVTVTPEALTANQLADEDFATYYCVSYEVVVEDGYNVYSADDFAYFENRAKYNIHQVSDGQIMKAWKEAKGIDTNTFYDNFVLQKDIKFTDDNVADGFKIDSTYATSKGISDEYIGSLLDNKDLYFHIIKNGETNYIDGNYFTLDTSAVSLVPYTGEDDYTANHRVSHTSLFRTNTQTNPTSAEDCNDGRFEIRNINLNGNASNGGDEADAWKNGGGLIFMKNEFTETEFYNTVARGWFITYFPNYNLYDSFTINKCKAYDSYSNFVYCWGASVTIKDSIMKQAGGPCIIADYLPVNSSRTVAVPSHVKVDANSVLESYVAGEEAWFQSFDNATTMAGSIKTMDGLLNAAGRTFLRVKEDDTSASTKYFNFLILYKSGGTEGLTATALDGDIQFGEGHTYDFNEGDVAAVNAASGDTTSTTLYEGEVKLGYPLFISSDSTSTTSGAGIYVPTVSDSALISTTTATALDSTADVFKGDHLGLYYNGMCICFTYDTFNLANYVGGTNPYPTW